MRAVEQTAQFLLEGAPNGLNFVLCEPRLTRCHVTADPTECAYMTERLGQVNPKSWNLPENAQKVSRA